MFQQAAIFPDLARGYKNQLKADFHRPLWHFINQPLYLTPADKTALEAGIDVNLNLVPPAAETPEMNVIQVIRHARTVLKDATASQKDKALMLSWLMHTVGDIHQPLHSSAMYSKPLFKTDNDHGGNSVRTVQRDNLHSVWDGFPGGNPTFVSVKNTATALVNDSAFTTVRMNAMTDLNEETWLKESVKFAEDFVYNTEVTNHLKQLASMHVDVDTQALKLSDAYLKDGGNVATQRVIEAGIRLGKIMKDAVSD